MLVAAASVSSASAEVIFGLNPPYPAYTTIRIDPVFLSEVNALGITAAPYGATTCRNATCSVLRVPAVEWVQDFGEPTLLFGGIHDGAGFSLSRTFAADAPSPFAGTTLTVYLTNFLINSQSGFGLPDNGTMFANVGVNVPVASIDFATLLPAYSFPLDEVDAAFGGIPNATFADLRLSLTAPAIAGLSGLLILPGETAPQPFLGIAEYRIVPAPAALALFGLGVASLAALRRRG